MSSVVHAESMDQYPELVYCPVAMLDGRKEAKQQGQLQLRFTTLSLSIGQLLGVTSH